MPNPEYTNEQLEAGMREIQDMRMKARTLCSKLAMNGPVGSNEHSVIKGFFQLHDGLDRIERGYRDKLHDQRGLRVVE